jgi:hypothetical protein
MIAFLADENINNSIIRGLLRQRPEMDIIRVQDVGLSGAEDPEVLEWAALHGRVLLTHDVSTITRYAYERVSKGQPMPDGIEVGRSVPMCVAIEDILCVAECSEPDEWAGQVRYLPLE